MEEEKETSEEKEEEEEQLHHHHMAASSVDQQDLPIMHWEDLSQRIAELEKQEQERTKRATGVTTEDEDEDFRRCRVAVVTSRFCSHRNLQLCFINDSDSDEDKDEQGCEKKVAVGTRHNGCHAAGLKQEVATALRTLRDELLAEQKEQEHLAGSSCVSQRKHLERWELQQRSVQQLCSLKASLQRDVHALSSELVAHLLVRDQLRTKQDAMLLDVQDLT